MLIISGLGYWVVLITYVILLISIASSSYSRKRNLHIDSRIEEAYFIRTELSDKMTYYNFKNTVYVFLFLIALIPLFNIIGVGYLLWILLSKD